MKTKIYTTFVFALICNGAFSQSVTITSSVCGSHDFTFSFVDGTGRNFLGGVFDALFWDAGTNEWQWTDYSTSPPVLLYTNSFASAPNPPCFNTGTWVQVNNLCGTITGITGDCQSSLTGIGDNEGSGRDFSVAFSQASGNIVLLLNSPVTRDKSVSIFNSLGDKVQDCVISTQKTELASGNLSNGIYVAQLNSDEGSYRKKFILLR